MNRTRIVKKPSAYLLAAVAVAAAFAVWAAVPASASTETAVSSLTASKVAIPANSSYVTDSYFGVVNLTVGNNSVAYASLDSQNHVVITAVGQGSTSVSFLYRQSAGDSWYGMTIPVEVSGSASSAASLSRGTQGIEFPQASVAVAKGSSTAVTGMKINGFAVSSNDLLWVSSDETVATVGSKTGEIRGVAIGTATVYAIDPATKLCSSVTATVY